LHNQRKQKKNRIVKLGFILNGLKVEHIRGRYFLINGKRVKKLLHKKKIFKNGAIIRKVKNSFIFRYGKNKAKVTFSKGRRFSLVVLGKNRKGLCKGEKSLIKGHNLLSKFKRCRPGKIIAALNACKAHNEKVKCFFKQCSTK